MDIQEVSAANTTITKKSIPTNLPVPPIAAKTLGSEMNIRLGPEPIPSIPKNTKTAGIIIIPAMRATPVSNISI